MSEYKQGELDKLHSTELEILAEIERVCKLLDITYFADWGTLLGAIRHNGFIPWDDDIDIGMLRKDYDLFIDKAPELLADNYTLQHFLIDANTPTYHSKVRKNGTLFVEEYLENVPTHKGIFVDIFPYDYVPEDEESRKKNDKTIKLFLILFVSKTVTVATVEKSKIKRFIFTVIRKIIHFLILPIPKRVLFNKLERLSRQYNRNQNCSRVEAWPYGAEKLNDIYPLVAVKFENTMIPVPKNWDQVLKNEYGDYMKLPAPNQRYTHSPKYLDFGDEKMEENCNASESSNSRNSSI